MKKFIQTIKNILSIAELKDRLLQTLLLLLVYRVGTFIVIPGVNPVVLDALNAASKGGGLLDFVNTFSGGAFNRASIFALGIMPYISASIIIQLLSIAVPQFQKMQKEGEDGRRRLNQITRYLTIAITGVQAFAYLANLKSTKSEAILAFGENPLMHPALFMVVGVLVLIAGTMFTMWLGEF